MCEINARARARPAARYVYIMQALAAIDLGPAGRRQRRGSPGAWGMKPVDTLDCDTDAPEFLDDQDERASLLGPARSGSAYAQEPLLAVSATGCTKHGRAVLTSHADALSLFCSARYRVPMLVVWATALGGAMHDG